MTDVRIKSPDEAIRSKHIGSQGGIPVFDTYVTPADYCALHAAYLAAEQRIAELGRVIELEIRHAAVAANNGQSPVMGQHDNAE